MLGSPESLVARYDVALLDLDGVVYLGEQAIDGVPQALAAARRAGMRLAFVTNNASRTPDQVASLLRRLQIPAEPADVITSSHAAAHFLADRLPPGAPVLVLGTTGLLEAIAERGLTPVSSADDSPLAVVQGYSPDLDWHALAEGMVAIRHGARWVATNLDPTVPSPRGPLPGNGSLVAALVHATGLSPEATGKPDPTMHAESVQRSGAKHPIVVGDRLDTDIEGARRVECASLLVLTGVTTAAELIAAQALHRPDFIGADVSALLNSHPEVSVSGPLVRCRAARVSVEDDCLVLTVASRQVPESDTKGGSSDDSDGLDALRCLAVAGWIAADRGGHLRSVTGADHASRSEIKRLGLDTLGT
jgi:HAD superfamily hydrolase (TIGR01450 family)